MNHGAIPVRRLSFPSMALGALLLGLAGCHSAFISATLSNHTSQPVRLLELDYPSASFGTNELAPGATFKYRFKVLGSGATRLSWTDAHEQEHTSAGPSLHEGQEGTLAVTIEQGGTAVWNPTLRH